MLNKIAIVLPVRDGGTGRSERLKRCLDSYFSFTENLSDVYVIVDEDEILTYEFLKDYDVTVLTSPHPITLIEKINLHALDLANRYAYVSFIGDDIVFKTNWESKFIEFLSKNKFALAYGNDLLQGQRLATHPCITSNMIKAVGFFGCPAVSHNYFDNYWMDIVRLVGELKYFDDVVMEHMHPDAGKAAPDNISQKISFGMYDDMQKYNEYMNLYLLNDVKKIKGGS